MWEENIAVYIFAERGKCEGKSQCQCITGIPEMLEIAAGKYFRENSGFALPVYDGSGEVERYNVFHASMLIRHDADGKMFLYDIVDSFTIVMVDASGKVCYTVSHNRLRGRWIWECF